MKIRSEQPRGRLGNFSKVGNAEGAKGKKKDNILVKKIPSSTSMSSYKHQPSTHSNSVNPGILSNEGPDSFASITSYNTGQPNSTQLSSKQPSFLTPFKRQEQEKGFSASPI